MKYNRFNYVEPEIKALLIDMEQGFALSGNFEQPEYGGEDNL